MRELPTRNSQPHADEGSALIWRLIVFILVYLALSGLYAQTTNGLHNVFLETLGSRPATAIVQLLTPEISAKAVGPSIVAAGGGLNIRNGCEGADLFILLTAAFAAAPLTLRQRLAGWALGLLLVVVINQTRIVALFYAYRHDATLFDLLHTLAAPVALILSVALYFHAWLSRCRRQTAMA